MSTRRDWQVGGLVTLEDARDVTGRMAIPENMRKSAAELVALAPDLIPALSSCPPILEATRTIPIVFVEAGLARECGVIAVSWMVRVVVNKLDCCPK